MRLGVLPGDDIACHIEGPGISTQSKLCAAVCRGQAESNPQDHAFHKVARQQDRLFYVVKNC